MQELVTEAPNTKPLNRIVKRFRRVIANENDNGEWIVTDLLYGDTFVRSNPVKAYNLIKGQDKRATKNGTCDVAVTQIEWAPKTRVGVMMLRAVL